MNILELIKDNKAHFVSYKEGFFIYRVNDFEFPVPLSDIGGATLLAEDKAIFFMRWIRKHINEKEKANT